MNASLQNLKRFVFFEQNQSKRLNWISYQKCFIIDAAVICSEGSYKKVRLLRFAYKVSIMHLPWEILTWATLMFRDSFEALPYLCLIGEVWILWRGLPFIFGKKFMYAHSAQLLSWFVYIIIPSDTFWTQVYNFPLSMSSVMRSAEDPPTLHQTFHRRFHRRFDRLMRSATTS